MMFLEQTQGYGNAAHALATATSVSGAGVDADAQQAPSLFELLMQERLTSGMRPAVTYIVQTLCDSYPQLSSSLPVRYVDESYALLQMLTERYFLTRYDCLAGERFYGLRRVMYHHGGVPPEATSATATTTAMTQASASTAPTTAPLTAQARRRSMLLAVLVPYLKGKLDAYYEQLRDQLTTRNTSSPLHDDSEQDHATARFMRRLHALEVLTRARRAFVAAYPAAHFVYQASFFMYQWLYLLGDTPYFSPLLRRLGVVLVRVSAQQETAHTQKQVAQRTAHLATLTGSTLLPRVRRLLMRGSWAVQDHSYALLALGLAGYKLLDWMYSEEGAAASARVQMHGMGANAPVPPPPRAPPLRGNAAIRLAAEDTTTCPLCQQQRVNPAASVAGIVFCYPCLYRHVVAHGECPTTRIKCDVTSITKIYDEDAVTTSESNKDGK